MSDKEYLEYLIDHYQNLIFSICFKFTANYFDAEDLAQETFLSAYKNFSQFDGKNEKAWLCRIATNKCLDYKKRATNQQIPTEDTYFLQMEDKRNETEANYIEKFEKEKLLQTCRKLKKPYDDIAEMYFYEELSVSQAAAKLGRNEKTVQTQVYRAKSMLKKYYERK